jgi:Kef-type K+ transport system membrane component KefB
MARTPLGTIALACAAVDDVTAWCLLAFVVSIAQTGAWQAAVIGLPAAIGEHIGHYGIFLAFLAGAVLPGGASVATAVKRRVEPVVVALMLPVFFAFSGLRTHIALIEGPANWAVCALIVGVACAGKFGGAAGAARIAGFRWRDAAMLGVLMNTRGLVELIVLNLGLDLGIISPRLFAMLVIMALVTTLMTSPLLQALRRTWPAISQSAPPRPAGRSSAAVSGR